MRLLRSTIERTTRFVVLAFQVEQPAHRLGVAAELRVGLLGLRVGDLVFELVRSRVRRHLSMA